MGIDSRDSWEVALSLAYSASQGVNLTMPVRVLSYGRKPHVYRVFFTVDRNASVVRVVHVRRGARRRPTADELTGE